MPSVYEILSEYTDESNPDSISVNPFWMIAVIRFRKPLTFNRDKLKEEKPGAVSFDSNAESLITERSMIVLSDDVLQMQIEHSKSSYVSSLSATLMSGSLNFLQEIQPNDWVFAWIVNSETQGRKIMDRVLKSEACNGWSDGLKFVGRVQGIRKKLSQSADGHRTVRYQLTAAGFKELDSTIFFDPNLAKQEESVGQFLTEMGVGLDEVFADADKAAEGLKTYKIIPRLLKLLVGEGVPPDAATFGPVQIAAGGTSTPEAPFAYAVPRTVLELLGAEQGNKEVPAYADIMEMTIGVQKYQNSAGSTTPTTIFAPDNAANQSTNFRLLNENLLGSFQPLPIAFSGKTVWSFLEEFKNPAINEMYTCLRINPQGRVVPTIVLRQLPFSTPLMMKSANADRLTGHLEVPRWNCHPILISNLDVGKSDSLHVNFVHVYGQASADGGVPLTQQIVTFPPIRDEADIKRSGLRMHMQTVNCSIDDTLGEPEKWMKILADFLIGQQYTLTGTADLLGVSAPICPGDNFEFDDTVYHIEAVAHSCQISAAGYKQFNTSLQLSHGIRTDTPDKKEAVVSKDNTSQVPGTEELVGMNSDLAIYTGMKSTDALGYDPGQTIDTRTERQSNTPENADSLDSKLFGSNDIGVIS